MKKYVNSIKIFMLMDMLLILTGSVATAFLPYLTMLLVDTIQGYNTIEFLQIALLYITLVSIDIISGYGSMRVEWKSAIKFENHLKRDFMHSLFVRPYSIFQKKSVGEHVSVQANDLTTLEPNYITPIISIVCSLILFFVYAFILFALIHPLVGLVLLVASIVSVFVGNINLKRLSQDRRDYQDSLEKYTGTVSELISGKKLINHTSIDKFDNEHEISLQKTAKKRYKYGLKKSMQISINGICIYSVDTIGFVLIAYLMFTEQISIGGAVAALVYSRSFVDPLREILSCITMLGSVKSIKEKVIQELGVTESEPKVNRVRLESGIKLHKVSLSQNEFSLKEVDLSFKKGKKYALVGLNGSGKSTILESIMGFRQITGGEILVDGTSITEINTSEMIYLLGQEPIVFYGDFNKNISLLGSYDTDYYTTLLPSLDKVITADVRNGANCKNLSGGEKQMICFLRMVNSKTDVWMLDEAFASMDISKSRYLEDLMLKVEDKTIIAITHDIGENLSKYDEVIVIKNGSVCQIGHYTEIKDTGEYQEILYSHKKG